MLHTETVEPRTFALLKRLMAMPDLASFSLVGGTALSLRYGHRTSIDLDLFSLEKFDNTAIAQLLSDEFGSDFQYEPAASGHFGVFCIIGGVKVDMVRFPHPLIRPTETGDGIRLYSSEDIAAMKIQAMLGRGRKKDFWDLHELLQHFNLGEIIAFHKEKYPNQMLLISIPNALTYFVDAEDSDAPVSLKGQTWEEVKDAIRATVREFLS